MLTLYLRVYFMLTVFWRTSVFRKPCNRLSDKTEGSPVLINLCCAALPNDTAISEILFKLTDCGSCSVLRQKSIRQQFVPSGTYKSTSFKAHIPLCFALFFLGNELKYVNQSRNRNLLQILKANSVNDIPCVLHSSSFLRQHIARRVCFRRLYPVVLRASIVLLQ